MELLSRRFFREYWGETYFLRINKGFLGQRLLFCLDLDVMRSNFWIDFNNLRPDLIEILGLR